MDDLNLENSTEKNNTVEQKHEAAAHKTEKSFVHRNKYRIRQICGILVLLGIITGTTVALTKCGSDIDDASSISAAEQTSETSSQTQTESTTEGTSESTSKNTTSQETTTSKDTTTTEQTTTEEPTTTEPTTTTTESATAPPTTTTAKKTTHNPKPTSKATTASPPAPVDGIKYINGIMIVNKTYPLPADYVPDLVPIDGYQYLERNTAAAFKKMQEAAYNDGVYLACCSGYRSYYTQQALYNNYVAYDGKANADRYSARPGYSEHQTGMAIDINIASAAFDNTPAAKWIRAHCAEYGFIIRYKAGKENKTGYMAESWHVRYLGNVQLCKALESSGMCLEEYFGITSVYANP